MSRYRSVVALAALALIGAGPAMTKPLLNLPPFFGVRAKPQPSLDFTYQGWRIDASTAAGAQSPTRTVRAIKAQIDIVCGLRLSPQTMAFMRAQPISADGAADPRLEPSQYVAGRGVLLHVRRLDAKKPELLFALLKAYQAERLPGGTANADVETLRRQAAASRLWPRTARMLQSDDDFFALTAGAYLYGAITREPYTRADLKKTQPQCYRWLAGLFDGGRPRG
jgi:hypothetical protein